MPVLSRCTSRKIICLLLFMHLFYVNISYVISWYYYSVHSSFNRFQCLIKNILLLLYNQQFANDHIIVHKQKKKSFIVWSNYFGASILFCNIAYNIYSSVIYVLSRNITPLLLFMHLCYVIFSLLYSACISWYCLAYPIHSNVKHFQCLIFDKLANDCKTVSSRQQNK